MSDQDKDVSKNLNIYKLDKTEDVMSYYADWAENNKYNKDMIDWNYTGPKETAAAFNKHQQNKDALILDAGCGTGLVAQELEKFGFNNFHGIDLSQDLLNSVPKNLYKKLSKLDLNKEIPEADNTYDSVLCVGTFTFGHVKNNALDEFLRITKSGGYIGFTINEGIFKKYSFDTKIEEFKNKELWEEKDFFKSDYIASKNVNAWLGIYKITK